MPASLSLVTPSELAVEPSLREVAPSELVTAASMPPSLPPELMTPSEVAAEPSLPPAEPPVLVTAVSTTAALPSDLVTPSEVAGEPSRFPVEPPALVTAESIPVVLPPDLAAAASALPSPVCAPSFVVDELEQAAKVAAANRTNARRACIRILGMIVNSPRGACTAFLDNTCAEPIPRCARFGRESGVLVHEARAGCNGVGGSPNRPRRPPAGGPHLQSARRSWSTERFASRREIAHLHRVPSLLVGQIRRVFSLLAPRAACPCAISLGPSNRSVL